MFSSWQSSWTLLHQLVEQNSRQVITFCEWRHILEKCDELIVKFIIVKFEVPLKNWISCKFNTSIAHKLEVWLTQQKWRYLSLVVKVQLPLTSAPFYVNFTSFLYGLLESKVSFHLIQSPYIFRCVRYCSLFFSCF